MPPSQPIVRSLCLANSSIDLPASWGVEILETNPSSLQLEERQRFQNDLTPVQPPRRRNRKRKDEANQNKELGRQKKKTTTTKKNKRRPASACKPTASPPLALQPLDEKPLPASTEDFSPEELEYLDNIFSPFSVLESQSQPAEDQVVEEEGQVLSYHEARPIPLDANFAYTSPLYYEEFSRQWEISGLHRATLFARQQVMFALLGLFYDSRLEGKLWIDDLLHRAALLGDPRAESVRNDLLFSAEVVVVRRKGATDTCLFSLAPVDQQDPGDVSVTRTTWLIREMVLERGQPGSHGGPYYEIDASVDFASFLQNYFSRYDELHRCMDEQAQFAFPPPETYVLMLHMGQVLPTSSYPIFNYDSAKEIWFPLTLYLPQPIDGSVLIGPVPYVPFLSLPAIVVDSFEDDETPDVLERQASELCLNFTAFAIRDSWIIDPSLDSTRLGYPFQDILQGLKFVHGYD